MLKSLDNTLNKVYKFSGYLAVGVTAYLTGLLANKYGVTPYPFYLGLLVAFIGLILTVFFVKETESFVKIESKNNQKS